MGLQRFVLHGLLRSFSCMWNIWVTQKPQNPDLARDLRSLLALLLALLLAGWVTASQSVVPPFSVALACMLQLSKNKYSASSINV